MVFDNIFNSASKGAKIFSVDGEGARSGEDTDNNLSSSKIHGASFEAKIVREESPEARNVLGFISALINTTQQAASEQKTYANDPGSTSNMASSIMDKSYETVKNNCDLQKDPDDLKDPYGNPPPPPPSAEGT